jgi:leucyl/phenylalanyl-tRNA---protein transferase
LRARAFEVIDCQLPSRHLASMGAVEIPRREFLSRLASSIDQPPMGHAGWCRERSVVRHD